MTLRPTELTIVLLWQHAFIRQPHTATMLPDLTAITLDEEVAQIIRHGFYETSSQHPPNQELAT